MESERLKSTEIALCSQHTMGVLAAHTTNCSSCSQCPPPLSFFVKRMFFTLVILTKCFFGICVFFFIFFLPWLLEKQSQGKKGCKDIGCITTTRLGKQSFEIYVFFSVGNGPSKSSIINSPTHSHQH